MKLAMRLAFMKNEIINFAFLLFSIQIMLNNLINLFIEIFFNEVIYEFKITKFVDLLFIKDVRIRVNDENSLIAIEEERNLLKKITKKVIVLTQVMQKIKYNSKHILINWKIDNRVNITLHKKYNYVTITFYVKVSRLDSIFRRRSFARRRFRNAYSNSIRVDYDVYSKVVLTCQSEAIEHRALKVWKHESNNNDINQICEWNSISLYDILEFSFYENALSNR